MEVVCIVLQKFRNVEFCLFLSVAGGKMTVVTPTGFSAGADMSFSVCHRSEQAFISFNQAEWKTKVQRFAFYF